MRGRGPIESRTRKSDWKYDQTVNMRELFRADIEKLSAEWKKDRAEKEEVPRESPTQDGWTARELGTTGKSCSH